MRTLHRQEKDASDGFILATPDTTTEQLNEFGRTYRRIRDEIDHIKSEALLRQADKYDIPVEDPIFSGNSLVTEPWRRSIETPNLVVLTANGRADLRAAIWEVQRQRWERWTRWVPLLTGLTGLFGTAIGLLLTLSKWF